MSEQPTPEVQIAIQPAETPSTIAIHSPLPASITAEMVLVESLSPCEMNQLQECEKTIERGVLAFVAVGNALLQVQEARLYRGEYTTFERYLKERWSLSRSRAYQFIDASRVALDLKGDPSLSQVVATLNESQARELVPLKEPEQRREAVRVAVEAKGNGDLTARGVREAAALVSGKSKPDTKIDSHPGKKHKSVKPEHEPPKADKPSPGVTTIQPPAGRVDKPMATVTRPEPAVCAATRSRATYLPEDRSFIKAVHDVFRAHDPGEARNTVDRLLAIDPFEVAMGDVNDVFRRCKLEVIRIECRLVLEPLATAPA